MLTGILMGIAGTYGTSAIIVGVWAMFARFLAPHSSSSASISSPSLELNSNGSQLQRRGDSLSSKLQSGLNIRVRIPKNYHHQPVISHLVSHYHLTVNILAALLGSNAESDGWFDLDLRGEANQIESALVYLKGLNLEILNADLPIW